jgi:hypothetical protein
MDVLSIGPREKQRDFRLSWRFTAPRRETDPSCDRGDW